MFAKYEYVTVKIHLKTNHVKKFGKKNNLNATYHKMPEVNTIVVEITWKKGRKKDQVGREGIDP